MFNSSAVRMLTLLFAGIVMLGTGQIAAAPDDDNNDDTNLIEVTTDGPLYTAATACGEAPRLEFALTTNVSYESIAIGGDTSNTMVIAMAAPGYALEGQTEFGPYDMSVTECPPAGGPWTVTIATLSCDGRLTFTIDRPDFIVEGAISTIALNANGVTVFSDNIELVSGVADYEYHFDAAGWTDGMARIARVGWANIRIETDSNIVICSGPVIPEPTEVMPEPPFQPQVACGIVRDVVVPTNTESVVYTKMLDGPTVTVTATAQDGFIFADDASTITWTFDTTPEVCPSTETPLDPSPSPTAETTDPGTTPTAEATAPENSGGSSNSQNNNSTVTSMPSTGSGTPSNTLVLLAIGGCAFVLSSGVALRLRRR